MKLMYLGTAAAEGWPAMYCNCDSCKRAKKAGGKNIRTRSQALINQDLLIDYPADTYLHVIQNQLDLSAVRYCLITHSHLDHFVPSELFFHNEYAFAHDMTEKKMDLYGNRAVEAIYQNCLKVYKNENPHTNITMHVLQAYETIRLGQYEVTPLPAKHAEQEDAFVYLIRDGKSTLLYLHDTGLPGEEMIRWLAANHIQADLISYDCTMGITDSCSVHMGLDEIPGLHRRYVTLGVASEKTIAVINHFSHNGQLIHDELVPVAEKEGIVTAWDGMTVEF